MRIQPPSCSDVNVIKVLIEAAEMKKIPRIDKCLVYAPDAIGRELYNKHTSLFAKVLEHAPIRVPLLSVFPPKTPVCYASMFTGALPEWHGIRHYEKPVLKCDTIFDAMVRAGKMAAIVAVENSSIDLIFRNRDIKYFSETYDEWVTNRTIELIKSGEYDFIVAYHQQYDDVLHKTTPQSEQAIEAVKNHISSFARMADTCELSWKKYSRLIAFAPDHGAHIDHHTGNGTHGEDIPEDMEIYHFYNISI
jgi:hypothetical protein